MDRQATDRPHERKYRPVRNLKVRGVYVCVASRKRRSQSARIKNTNFNWI